MRPIVVSARAKAAVKTGAMKKNIAMKKMGKKKLRQTGGDVGMSVGIRGGAKEYVNNKRNRSAGRVGDTYEHGGNFFYFRFLEFGTSKMNARPFLRPAMAENIGKAQSIFTEELGKDVHQQARRR